MKPAKNPYHALAHLVMRFPRCPLGTIIDALKCDAQLHAAISSEAFKNALLFASPALYDELKRYLNGEIVNAKNQFKVKLSALKYLSRMSTRCTPFASLATCGSAHWSDSTHIVPNETIDERFRLDMLYTCIIAEMIARDHNVREHLRYRLNTAVYETGKYLRFITQLSQGMGRTFQVKEIARTRPLVVLRKEIKDWTSFDDLIKILVDRFELEEEKARHYIHSLIDAQLLMSEIEPFVIGDDFLSYLCDKLEGLNTKWNALLKDIYNKVSLMSSRITAAKNEQLQQDIKSKLEAQEIKVNPKYLVQLDCFSKSEEATVSRKVLSSVRQGLEFYSSIQPLTGNSTLEQFRKRFQARYQDQEIPLLEALDPDIGVGYQLTQDKVKNPLVDNINLPRRLASATTTFMTPFHQVLMRKLSELNWKEADYIEITDDDIISLPANYNDLPASMAAMFELLETADGDFMLCNVHYTGSTAANLLGRFAYGDTVIQSIVADVVTHEQEYHSDKIVAEIAHIPQGRTGNILFRPHIYDYEIGYMSNSQATGHHYIPASDLCISVNGNRVVLRSARLDKEILPRLTTAHNYSGTDTSPVYRFLCDMQRQYGRSSFVFSWGCMAQLPRLPRVKYKNIILARQRWNIKTEELPFKKMKFDAVKWDHWKMEGSIPRYVMLTVGDNKLFVDTASQLSVEAMLSELGASNKSFVLEEFMPAGFDVNQHHDCFMNECIVPLIRTKND